MTFGTRVPVLFLLLLLAGCTSTPLSNSLFDSPPLDLRAETRLDRVPFFPQDKYQCGPAALATILAAAGVPVVPDDLIAKVYVPGKKGSYQLELVTASRSYDRMAYQLSPSLENLLKEVEAGNPVLVLQNLGLTIAPQWHFAVVKGYDLPAGNIILNSGQKENYVLSMKVFERTWTRAKNWGLVVTEPGELPATAEANSVFNTLTALEHSQADHHVILAYYNAALAQWPRDTSLHMGYGNLMVTIENLDAAERAYHEIIANNRDYAPALNNLAYILFQQARYEEALGYAERAIAQGGEFHQAYEETWTRITNQLGNTSL